MKEQQTPMVIFHTLRIEMMDNSVLIYNVFEEEKEALQAWMHNRTDPFDPSNKTGGSFLIFHALPDRYVFIRVKNIARLIFCWSATAGPVSYEYIDNFDVLPKPDGSMKVAEEDDLSLDDFIPAAIIKLSRKKEPLVFDYLSETEECGLLLDDESFTPNFVKGGFICLPDEDGEDNYIPVANISCIEAKRCLVIPDDIWDETHELEKTVEGKKSGKRKKS